MTATQGERIIRFQHLYKTYSSLAFTNPSDRPIAVEGIQSRLFKIFEARGGYGIFDEHENKGKPKSSLRALLRRSLLWWRLVETELTRIKFPAARKVPTWSWMAYLGEIDFLRLEFGGIDWMDLKTPWSKSESWTVPMDRHRGGHLSLTGNVRDIRDGWKSPEDGMLRYDIPSEIEGTAKNGVGCVVLGIEKGECSLASKMHYLLLVRPLQNMPNTGQGSKAYERVGAGHLRGQWISSEKSMIWIC